ncbi:MAG TPA: hypothetical protein VGS19_13295, partial [Streptosporangiaceae bacterium]|nr:hypothetical protein [Streptosporangiaceae bacterium]
FGTELDGPEVSALLTELRDPRWSLLTMQGTGLPPLTSPDDVLSVHTVAPGALCYALGLGAGRWVLVRPDGYVAARGDSPATLPGTLASLPGLGPRRVAATHQAD